MQAQQEEQKNEPLEGVKKEITSELRGLREDIQEANRVN